MTNTGRKAVRWIASSRRDMQALPVGARRTFGLALFAVQSGETPPIAKPLNGFGGAGVLELIDDEGRSTYRCVYAVRYSTAVYVLHVFQKKSKQGISTPQVDIDLIKERLKRAEAIHRKELQ